MEKENGIYKIECSNGYYLFKLESLLTKLNKTKYSVSKDLLTEYKVINRYAHGNLKRVDLLVIAKICDYCNCNLNEIIEYYPNKG